MKTIAQIRKKVESLKMGVKRHTRTSIYENFGDTQQRKLADYIGYIYDYDYRTRQTIEDISQSFFQWCANHCK